MSFLRAPARLRPLFERDTLTTDSDKTHSVIIFKKGVKSARPGAIAHKSQHKLFLSGTKQ